MTLDNFRIALRSFARQAPFRPFHLEMMTGEKLLIKHPEAVALIGQIVVFRSPSRKSHFFDSASVLQLMEIDN